MSSTGMPSVMRTIGTSASIAQNGVGGKGGGT
jgi:hypothetical protein